MVFNSLILASASPIRQTLLRAAGVPFEVQPATIDERQLQDQLRTAQPKDLALELARAKALFVSASRPSQLILGADQVLERDGTVFHKARSLNEARDTLLALRAQTHRLHSAIACAADGTIVFEHISTAHLTMRDFSEDFLAQYLEAAGKTVLGSVGCYHYEGLGLQLFEKIEGDYHTILGLPLLPLLAFLRQSSIVPI
jgi:septum formation protein